MVFTHRHKQIDHVFRGYFKSILVKNEAYLLELACYIALYAGHGWRTFYRAVEKGVRAHHWQFGDLPPIKNIPRSDLAKIINYVRHEQRKAGIHQGQVITSPFRIPSSARLGPLFPHKSSK